MKKLIIGLFICLTGCGMSYDSKYAEDGHTVARSYGSVGYASAESTYEHNDPRYEACLADVGDVPNTVDKDGHEIDTAASWCLAHVRRGLNRDDRQLDQATQPYYYGSPYLR
ncbi:MAG: hypothetical protein ABIO72_03270 [Patescibacteria group bacterium]